MKILLPIIIIVCLFGSCSDPVPEESENIFGFDLLNRLSGHWVGENQTSFGLYPWFAFDFRPISASHVHSIYEGGTDQNIITSIFVADHDGEQQVMARNGGWLGNQYRATYFVLDKREEDGDYYRLVDAVGGEDRAYLEFRFSEDSLRIDAYKDNSGALDKPIHHMGFSGVNKNASFAQAATSLFNFPQPISEVDLNDQFTNLIDPDSALFLEESNDPFPKSAHGHLSELTIEFSRNSEAQDQPMLLFLSAEPLVSVSGNVSLLNIDDKVIRTISITQAENSYVATYLHPDEYYVTAFVDNDNDNIPSSGDVSSASISIEVLAEKLVSLDLPISMLIP